ncbi:substrate-binding domain-containing protein, partial [Corynebacterium argentoratense]
FASEHPETVKQVVAGFYSAYAKLKADPSVGVEAAQKLIPELSEPEQLKAAKATMDATAKLLPGPDTCGELTEESARKMVEALKDVGIEGIQVDGSDLYSTQYCP